MNAAPEARTALVIGNSAYRHTSPLANPSNDASDMAAMLKGLDFEVISGVDSSRAEMDRLIREFGKRLRERGGMGLFYYAGHGVQVEGRNYLIPVDADIRAENEVKLASYDVGWILAAMENAGNNLNIVILDACRNNPFSRSWRSASDGLAQIDAPMGTLIAYSTAPGRVAADGIGRNAPYTAALLKALNVPDLSEADLFKMVRAEVQASTGGRQTPWEQTSLTGKFVFRRGSANEPSASATPQPSIIPAPLPTPMVSAPALPVEEQYWQVVSSRNSITSYQQYLAEYPRGKYAGEANTRINAIKAEELRKQKEVELGRWNDARRADTRESYNAYIAAYPNGGFVAQARQGIRDLEITEERRGWSNARTLNTKEAYRAYIATYPNGEFVAQATQGIRDLEAGEEKRVWDDAVILNRKSAFDSYLNAYPSGTYSSQAKAKIKEFERAEEVAKWNEAESLNTVAAYQEYLKLYPKGEFVSLARLRLGDFGVRSVAPTAAPFSVVKTETGIELVYIPQGSFRMGLDNRKFDTEMRKVVDGKVVKTIERGFWIGKYEVTVGEWRSVMGYEPGGIYSYPYNRCDDRCPVNNVSWDDIHEFLGKLNERDDGFLYSLPTEVEWEYAARAGGDDYYVSGNKIAGKQANYGGIKNLGVIVDGDLWDGPIRVGSYKPNAWGLHDVMGNVAEWTDTDFKPRVVLIGYKCSDRKVVRGGSYDDSEYGVRLGERTGDGKCDRRDTVGFRVLARPAR